jgi:hypothetical protein
MDYSTSLTHGHYLLQKIDCETNAQFRYCGHRGLERFAKKMEDLMYDDEWGTKKDLEQLETIKMHELAVKIYVSQKKIKDEHSKARARAASNLMEWAKELHLWMDVQYRK